MHGAVVVVVEDEVVEDDFDLGAVVVVVDDDLALVVLVLDVVVVVDPQFPVESAPRAWAPVAVPVSLLPEPAERAPLDPWASAAS